MKKVMILGANDGQIPFMHICRGKGAYVIAVSIEGDYPGFRVADKSYYCDIRDKDAILKIAMEEGIDAILTDQTDVSVPTVAYVAEKMGLKGIGYETALKFTDKYIMRCEAKKAGIKVPNFGLATSYEEALKISQSLRYPIIVKPTNSSGSRGVIKVNDVGELKLAIAESLSCSGNNRVIVEEFIIGREYLVDGFALNYDYINTDLGIKEYFDKPNMYISKMCMFSSASLIDDANEEKVLNTNKKLVEAFGLKFGITHGEYILSDADQEVYLVEIAARGGGVYVSSDLTPLASGINTNELLVAYVLNDVQCNLKELVLDNRVAAWRCFELTSGTVTSIENIVETERIDGVYKVCLDYLNVGDKIFELTDDTRKHGPVLVTGNSREDCFSCIDKVKNTLKITTSHNGKSDGIIW
jgi:carbamoyl-phosphate synthase large subunit